MEKQGTDAQHKTEERDGMIVEWDVPIDMDDGVVLRADVFRPSDDDRYPLSCPTALSARDWPFRRATRRPGGE